MKTIKLSTAQTCSIIFNSQRWSFWTTKKDVQKLFLFLHGKAIAERKKGNVQLSNNFINYAIMLSNLYQCSFQCAKKYRKAFNISED